MNFKKLTIIISFFIISFSVFLMVGPRDYTDALKRPYSSHKDNEYFKLSRIPISKETISKHSIPRVSSEEQTKLKLTQEEIEILTKKYNSYSFMVMKNNSIVSENYFNGNTNETKFNPFSASKSIVSLLVGIAVEKGYIHSLDDYVSKYIPEIQLKNTKIRDVLRMSSGMGINKIHWFIGMGLDYYAQNLTERVMKFGEEYKPGTQVVYNNMNTQLLGMIIEKTSGRKLHEFEREYLWNYIGVGDVEWCEDNTGHVKAYCCHFVNTESMMKLGQLVINKGVVDGKQIVPEWYIEEMFTPDENMTYKGMKNEWYGYQAWVYKRNGIKIQYFSGMKGQLVIVIPELNIVVTRFGKDPHMVMRDTMEPFIDDIYPIITKFL